MSKIQEQIKELQLKQKKIDYINYLEDLIANDTNCVDFFDIKPEILDKVSPFLKNLVSEIETDSLETPQSLKPGLTDEELNALKLVAQKVLNKPEEPVKLKPTSTLVKQPSHADKINFAMNNRHLANKEVQVINDQNVTILGTVVGLDYPHVLVKTTTGPTIQVPLEKVVLNEK